MFDYAIYIWPAYGLSFLVLLGLWLSASKSLAKREKHLLFLQNSLKPDRE